MALAWILAAKLRHGLSTAQRSLCSRWRMLERDSSRLSPCPSLPRLVNESASPYRRSIVVRNGPQTESLQSDVMRLPSAEIVPMQLPTE